MVKILRFQLTVLKYLFVWPKDRLDSKTNRILSVSYFTLSVLFCLPILGAVLYEALNGMKDPNIAIEATIALCDATAYYVVFLCFLKNQAKIAGIVKDVNLFLNYCEAKLIEEIDATCHKYTKYLLTYVTFGVLFNLLWPQITINQCTSARGELVKHMPCGMVTQNYFPFDTRDTYVYWTIFFYFVNFCLHICVAFSIGTSVFIGLLMHTIGQLKNCSSYFKSIFFGADIATKFRLSYCIRYHQTILSYAERIFSTFTSILITYVTITSFTFAVVSYQIANSKTAIEERIRYVLLLVGWIILFFLICFFAQEVIDQSLKVGDAVYHSNWHLVAGTDEIKRSLAVVILRTQRPICWKVKYIGTMSLFTFVYVIKTSYTFFTLLLTATDSA